jgi:hypothetical protein
MRDSDAPGPVDKAFKEPYPMATVSAAPAVVKTAVLFDSASFVHHAPDFGTFVQPDRMTVDQEMAYWDEVAAKRRAEYAAREARRKADTAALLSPSADEIGRAIDDHFGPFVAPAESCKTIEAWEAEAVEVQAKEVIRVNSFDLSGMAWTPRMKGYTAQDLDDYRNGRLITLEELLAREEAEDDARLLANCPAEVHEEMLHECEWARPFLA